MTLVVGRKGTKQAHYRVHKHMLAVASEHIKNQLERLEHDTGKANELVIEWLETHHAELILSWIYGAGTPSITNNLLKTVTAPKPRIDFSATWAEYLRLYNNALALEAKKLVSELAEQFNDELNWYMICTFQPTKEMFDVVVRVYETGHRFSDDCLERFCKKARKKGKNGMPLVGWLDDVVAPTPRFLRDFMMACARLGETTDKEIAEETAKSGT